MATIRANTAEKVFSLKEWGGLHESPDGDTKLKIGEASSMRNFAVTRDGNLRRRAGVKTLISLLSSEGNTAPVRGLWTGFINQTEYIIAACDGKLWKINYEPDGDTIKTEIGSINTDNEVHMFGFSEILYVMDGHSYKQYDGNTLIDVEGYIPLVTVAVPPDGGGETLERINRLNGKRRMWISPDGTGSTFKLPEKNVSSIDWVKDLKTGATLTPTTEYTVNLTDGTVTFTATPQESVNSYEIAWTVPTTFRSQVTAMRYSELYSGTSDTRVFIYGDGSNKALYSDLDYSGVPRADYFPDLNDVSVGDENTPITALIRHYSRLLCFKSDSAWAIQYGSITLEDGSLTAAFYVTPTNKRIGNAALGQVRLVLNAPYTVFGSDIYEWRNNSSYTSNLSTDERQAKRISDRIYSSITQFDLPNCFCWDDNDSQEYYICNNGKAVVYNYASDAWYIYTDFDVTCMMNYHGELFIGSSNGAFKRFSYDYLTDDDRTIDAYWESGSMDFGADNQRKYSAMLWIGVKPEDLSELDVTIYTDRDGRYAEKVVENSLFSFENLDFLDFSFDLYSSPKIKRLKIKAKKFVYYKLILRSTKPNTTVTITSADIRVRYTGNAK